MPETNDKLSGDVKVTSPFFRWLENFWYHYKWPFLLGLFMLIVLTVCFTQCAKNGKGNDVHVMYAGDSAPSPNKLRELENLLKEYAPDRNEDGKIVVAIQNYAIYTEDEIRALPEDAQGTAAQLTHDNKQQFEQDLYATLCFLAPELYEAEVEAGGLIPLADMGATVPTGVTAMAHGGTVYGVRLFDLPIAARAAFSTMPKDTVLCVRRSSEIFGDAPLHEANVALFLTLLSAE